ncbi:hypothetical protein V1264_017384 [Littorina saxatilis]|uniref:G-protein coupled receptors family 1 profile domain-containing protein n=1 Tax=Littorina saxatilis TaxID=31220 RepID=A0AAN9BIG1_9CAEN
MNKWADDTVAYLPFAISSPLRPYQECYFVPFTAPYARASRCLNFKAGALPQIYILCEFKQPPGAQEKKKEQVPDVMMVDESWAHRDLVSVSRCPSGHYVQSFLACDVKSACWAGRNRVYGREGEGWGVPSPSTCTVSDVTPLPPSFACANGKQHVTYSQVCDFRPDCVDDSDEDFCDYPACSFQDFHCNSRQCVSLASRCDQYVDCYDGSDEDGCGVDILGIYPRTYPAIVDFDAQGIVSLRPLSTSTNSSSSCPAGTHFLCPGKGYCLPVYTRCNGVNDCPGREDEADCESYTCPGFYRCWDSHVCVHPAHLCDGWSQCPLHDDERYCGLRCPDNCTCFAWVFFCPQTFKLEQHRAYVRYLDAGGSGMTLTDVQGCGMLIHLSLARCGLPLLDRVPMPNLNSLTLSDNLLRAVTAADFLLMPSLKVLFLSGNPLQSLFQEILGSAAPVMNLQWLDVSRVQLKRFNFGSLQGARSVQTLNLSDSSLSTVVGEGFQVFPLLRVLDLRGCPVSAFSLDIFQGLENLDTVDADNPWLCCRHVLPAGFDTSRCSSPSAIVSTCEDLIGQSWHRVVAIVTCAVTCAGNVVSFSLRVLCRWRKPRSAFSVLVSHLSLSDLLMGLHLLVLVVADAVFRGSYVLRDVWWRQGAVCSAAGVVWVACSVVSLALLCVLTVHCIWTLYRHTGVLASPGSAHALSAGLWAVGVLVGIVPLLPGARHWEVFSSTALCRPLLLHHRHHHDDGWLFASTVHLVPNLLLGAFVAGAGLLIRLKTRHGVINDPALVSDQDQTRVDTCGRMVDIVLINGVCRVATGFVGLVASLETGVDRDVSVAVSMIALPLTSALNPCLYLLAAAFGIARKEQHRRLVQILSAQKPKTVKPA